ncbi:MAG: hypothetical protein WC840_02480 [Candidatus Peribacteraceae bacterium]
MVSHPVDSGEPKYFYPLVAVTLSLIVLGILEINAVSAANTVSTAVRDPRSLGHDLFDVSQFRTLRRARHAESVSSSVSSSSSASVHPAAENTPWALEDLTSAQRDTLRKQLRMSVCPQKADTGYRLLCENLLKEQGPRPVRQGLKNPHQQ